MRLLCLFAALFVAVLASASDFYLHDGDTVVFYGDSITNQRLYTSFTEAYVLTRFPKLRLRFVDSGVPGDRVSGGPAGGIDERLRHDVFAYHPTVVTVMLGMNDGEYRARDEAIFGKYVSGYRHIIEEVRTELPQARITLLQPSAYDDVTRPPLFEGGYNTVLLLFGAFVQKLANREGLVVADLNRPVVSVLRAAQKTASQRALDLIPDRVHPSPGVHMIMAEALLKAWRAPSVVTMVEIDALAGVLRKTENTSVDSLEWHNGISWMQTDEALPMPLDPPDETIALAVGCSDFTSALNQEILKVTDLGEGTYRLRIDDEVIGSFDGGQLAAGINLATLTTPMSTQAQAVLDLTHRHNHLHFARWRIIEDGLREYRLNKVQPALEALDGLENEVISLQQATALPKPHRYQLTKE